MVQYIKSGLEKLSYCKTAFYLIIEIKRKNHRKAMMFLSEITNEGKLLYDPMFAQKPDVDLKNDPKAGLKKVLFIVIISFFVGLSLYLSFNALNKPKYEFSENENGYTLSAYSGGESDTVLVIDYVKDEKDVADESKIITNVREFAVCCNEYVELIYIGKDVETLENHCFYYCKNLKAVIVDPENSNYTSVDGVLYSKDMTKIILHPIKNAEYVTSIALGAEAPLELKYSDDYLRSFKELIGYDEEKSEKLTDTIRKYGGTYEIADTVTEICDSCFSDCSDLVYVKIPEGVKTVGQLAFFKCTSLETLYIPDTVEEIKSDGFSYCETLNYIFVPENVKTIGHHAFFGCLGCENICLEADNLDGIDIGENWLPKKDKRSLKEIEVLYSQERRNG